MRYRQLDGLAFGCGPGSFTGLRIACGVAQGLALGADLPVLGVSTLEALAEEAGGETIEEVLACLDARMGEVYEGLARGRPDGGVELLVERLSRPEGVSLGILAPHATVVGAGHGLSAHLSIGQSLGGRIVAAYPAMLPRAHEVARLAAFDVAAGRVVAPDAAQPVYLRDDVATRSARAPVM